METAVAVERDEEGGEGGVKHAPPGDRQRGKQTRAGDATRAAEGGTDEKSPEKEVGGEEQGDPAREASDPSTGDGFPGGELPTGERLGEDELERGGERDGPEERRAKIDTGDGCDDNIARSDAGRGEDEAWAEERRRCSRRSVIRRVDQKASARRAAAAWRKQRARGRSGGCA